ncbi:MAG: hypothetical protein KY476_03290 [Planctomycetes bacterium]|nr:hypothetical protein [Planctomycetota bacterium]
MHWSIAFALLSAAAPTDTLPQLPDNHFNSYTAAWKAARQHEQPLLVILNPPRDSEDDAIAVEDVRKTRQRRELLENYVVAVIDTGTRHGKLIDELFGSPDLPRVVVIDKRQKYQIFRSSEPMYGQLWTEILEKYEDGETPVAVRTFSHSQPAYSSMQGSYCRT